MRPMTSTSYANKLLSDHKLNVQTNGRYRENQIAAGENVLTPELRLSEVEKKKLRGEKDLLGLSTSAKSSEDFKSSISPSEKEKAVKVIANKQAYGEFEVDATGNKTLIRAGEKQLREGLLADARSDFLLINDVPVSGAAVSSISIRTDTDVSVVETLRASAPIIESKGTGLDMVSISLSFPNGDAQTRHLRRIVAEIIRHPFVFIENSKIRDAVGYNSKTMIFALHSASLRSGGEAVGLIFLDLQLSIFNYKPFSNHYWYNTSLPGVKTDKIKASVAEVLMPDYGGRFSFDYDVNKYDEFGFEDLTPSDYSINTPTVYPANSDAWMYYANHLENKTGAMGDMNKDYVGFVLTNYQIFQPPPKARAGAGNAAKIFGVHGQYNKVSPFFDAGNPTSSITKDSDPADSAASSGPTTTSSGRTNTSAKGKSRRASGGLGRKWEGSRAIANKRIREEAAATYSTKSNSSACPNDLDGMLKIAQGLVGEGGANQSRDETSLLMWGIMNRNLLRPADKKKSYLKTWIDFSQPINPRWARGGDKCSGGRYKESHCSEEAFRRRERTSKKTWDHVSPRMVNAIFDFRAGKLPQVPGFEGVWDWASNPSDKKAVKTGKKGKVEVECFMHEGNVFYTRIGPVKSNPIYRAYKNGFRITVSANAKNPGEPVPVMKEETDKADKKENKQGDKKDKTEAKKQQQAEKKQKAETEKNSNAKDPSNEVEKGTGEKTPKEASLGDTIDAATRENWINEMERSGWMYHDTGGTRNVFYKDKYFFVGGSASPEKDIILSAITVNFGHRLAPIKPLGQHAPAWQFMGAGNKTGIFVFTAANQSGRKSLKRFRDFYQVSQQNARLFPYIEGAGSIRTEAIDLYQKSNINNILSLAGVNEIVITNIENQVDSSQGVDIHSLVVSWIAYEIPKEELKGRGQLNLDAKRAIAKALIKKLYWRTVEKSEDQYVGEAQINTNWEWDRWDTLGTLATLGVYASWKGAKYGVNVLDDLGAWDILASQMRSTGGGMGSSGQVLGSPSTTTAQKKKIIEDPRISEERLYRQKRANHRVGIRKDVMVWDSKSGQWVVPTNSKYEKAKWFTDLVRKMYSVIDKYKTSFPNLNIQRPGSDKGVTWSKFIQQQLGSDIHGMIQGDNKRTNFGFVTTSSDEERSRIISSLYQSMIKEIASQVVDSALPMISDAENFKEFFGKKTWQSIINAYLEEPGECYIDLDMPPELTAMGLSKGNGTQGVNYPPDFFLYDDSAENAVLDESNNPKNTENMVRSHLTNEARSIHEYVRATLFGGSQVSQNALKIRENKSNLNEIFGSEYDYFGVGATAVSGANTYGAIEGFGNSVLAWGLKAFSATLDDALGVDDYAQYGDTIQAETNRALMEQASGGPEGMARKDMTPEQKKIDGFLNMSLDWSSTATNFTLSDSSSNVQDRLGVREAAKAHIYSSYTHPNEGQPALESIVFGPDKDKMKSDGIIAGTMSPNAEEGNVVDPNTGETKQIQYYSPTTGQRTSDPNQQQSNMSDLENPTQKDKPIPSETEGEYVPPAAQNDFTDTFSTYAAGLSAASRQKDLSMRRAYPTFKIYFIDEDEAQGSTKLRAFDDFYSYSCVQEIKIIRSRKVAADLAIVRLSNVSDVLLSKKFQRGDDTLMRQDGKGHKQTINGDGTAATGEKEKPEEEKAVGLESQTDKENPFGGMMLQPGVKTQIRLGYASDPDNLETVFLGQIVEAQPSEDNNIIELVCQGYGAELEAAECGDIEKASPAFSAQSALSAAICMPFITHFGRKSPNATYNPTEVRTHLDGGQAEDFFEVANIFQLGGSVMSAWYHDRLRTHDFLNKPQDDNIYAPPISLYTTGWSRFWDNAAAYRPLGATTWDVFKEHELRHPGFISSAVPYGHDGRMTMFFGSKGQNYWSKPPSKRSVAIAKTLTGLAKDISWDAHKFYSDGAGSLTPALRQKLEVLYRENKPIYSAFMQSMMGMGGEKAIGFAVGRAFGRYVPFRNYHTFTSEHHILKNTIRANVQGTYNTVEVRFSADEDIARPKTFFWSEWLGKALADEGEETVELYRKVQEGNDGRFTLKLNDKMPDHLVRKHMEAYPSCITDYMASRYAQGLLIRGLKDVYRGELVVIGDERIKPYDICMLQDNKNSMYGPVEVEQVVHIFNSQQGFLSIVTPDLCIDFNDFTSKGIMDAITNISALAWAISTDSTMAAISKNYNPGSTVSSALAVGAFAPADQLFGSNMGSVLGSAMMMHFDQTGSPFIITPLMYGGKPLLGLSLAPKYSNWVMNMWGDFKDYVYDLKEGASQFDWDESFQEWTSEAEESLQKLAGNQPDWSNE